MQRAVCKEHSSPFAVASFLVGPSSIQSIQPFWRSSSSNSGCQRGRQSRAILCGSKWLVRRWMTKREKVCIRHRQPWQKGIAISENGDISLSEYSHNGSRLSLALTVPDSDDLKWCSLPGRALRCLPFPSGTPGALAPPKGRDSKLEVLADQPLLHPTNQSRFFGQQVGRAKVKPKLRRSRLNQRWHR